MKNIEKKLVSSKGKFVGVKTVNGKTHCAKYIKSTKHYVKIYDINLKKSVLISKKNLI